MTIDNWRARYGYLNDEADRLRAEVERLREDAARARWCEENKADVVWDWRGNQWRCETAEDMWMDQDRNAAIDYVRTGVPFWQSTAVQAERDAARAGEARAVEALQNLRIPLAQLGDFMYSPVRDASQELLAIVDLVLANTYTQLALDWLAQQRAEAVAAWIEKQVAENLERYGTHYYERTTDDLMREAAAFRAAALRAGEVGND